MPKKRVIGLVLLVLLLVCSQALLNSLTISVCAAEPSKLKIYVAPPSVPADKGDYEIILIQLQDSKNEPARAPEDTNISLSSSQINIGTVDHLITIPKGSTQATAKFHTTYTSGTTEITAASTGYMTVEAPVTTVGPIPSALAVYGFPPVLPADGGAYEALVVQLQDASGFPARAPLESVQVALSSSNNTIAAVVPSVTIEAGSTHAIATITTTQEIGSANITAMASGYSSKQTKITTQNTIMEANNLKIYVGPPSVLAEGKSHNQILVQRQNASGGIAQATSDTTVTLSSVNTDVGTVETTITIPANRTYATANFTSTYRSGTTIITAAATNYTTNQASLTTVGPIPTKLAVYCLPSLLPADNQQYRAIQVQLQDSQGKPAKDPEGDIIVNLFSSDPECGTVQATLTIPFGETYATGNFTSTTAANATTTITAQTSGYEPGQTVMTTKSIDEFRLDVAVTANPETVNSAQQTTLRARVTFKDTPVLRAKLTFNSNLNGGKFSNVTEEGNGYYTTMFTAPNDARNNTICTITANATKTGYISGITQLKMTINPSDIPVSTLQIQIVDENGSPVSSADVAIASQLTPDQTTSATTNDIGYVTFESLIEGDYVIQVTKDGYNVINQTITCPAGRTLSQTLILSPSPLFSLVPLSLPMLILIIVIVVVAVVAVVVGVWYIRRRRNSDEESAEEGNKEETEESTEEGDEETTEESAEETTEETTEKTEESTKESTEKTTEKTTEESTEEPTEEKMNLVAKCPKCGKEVKNPKKVWTMAGKPDKSGRRMQLTIGLYECCGKTFRQVLDKRKI